jgi:PAS domain S-box-containing protein
VSFQDMSIPLQALLVEDSPSDAELLLAALTRDGFAVQHARVEDAAGLQAALRDDRWEVVLCDYSLPRFSAPDAVRLVRQLSPDLPVIVISGTIGEEQAVEAIKLGATDYLLKDRLAGIGLAVRRALEQRRAGQAHAAAAGALLRSQESLAQAQRIAHIGSWDLELVNLDQIDANPLRWSAEMFRIFGYEPGEIEVTNDIFFRSVHPDDRAMVRAALAGTLRSGSTSSIDHRIVLADGRERVVHEEASLVRDGAGRPLRLVGTTQDVTDRWHIAEALRESEQHLRMVTDNARVGLVMINAGRRYTFANDTYLQMMELPSAEIIGRPVADGLGGLYEDQIKPRLDRAFAGERVAHELTRPGAAGVRTYAVRYEPMKLPAGEPLVLVVVTDVTERKVAEELMRASEARYHTLFEYAPDGIVIADRESYYLDVNASACRMLGYARDEFIGLHARDIVVPAETPHIATALDEIKNGPGHHREWQFRRKDGSTFAAEVIATEMPDGNLLGMIRDISERRQTEEAIQAQLSELRRWHVMTLGREEHIINLKREINELLVRQGLPPRYTSPDAAL